MPSAKAALVSTSMSIDLPTRPAFVVSTLSTGGLVGTGARVAALLDGNECANGEFWNPRCASSQCAIRACISGRVMLQQAKLEH